MRRILTALAVVSILTSAGCQSSDDPTPGTTTLPATGTVAPAQPEVTESPIGRWTGIWRAETSSGAAVLEISQDDPLTAHIEIAGICAADWAETSRTDESIRVTATVTSGDCIDNEWDVVIDGDQLSTTDPANDSNSVKLRRQN